MEIYQQCRLSGVEFTKSMIQMDPEFINKRRISEEIDELEQQEKIEECINEQRKSDLQNYILKYATRHYPHPPPSSPPTVSRIAHKRYCDHGFMETPQFWEDLIEVGSKIARTPVGDRN